MFNMKPEKLREFRLWIQKTIKECDERLAREKVALYKLNEQRTFMKPVGYMTKGEAINVARGAIGGELLDLDNVYGGMFVRADHLFISENKLVDGLRRYGSDVEPGVLISRLIDERCNERRVT